MDAQAMVAWHLRRLRVQRGLSQEALAVDAGIDHSYVGRLERRLENPTVSVLERLAGVLNVPIGEFFTVPPADEPWPAPLRSGRRSRK